MDMAEWLRGLGLEQYVPAFRDNDIDGEVLRGWTRANGWWSLGPGWTEGKRSGWNGWPPSIGTRGRVQSDCLTAIVGIRSVVRFTFIRTDWAVDSEAWESLQLCCERMTIVQDSASSAPL